jgi:pimeloyl-ACP methyl ester carboxylesterase
MAQIVLIPGLMNDAWVWRHQLGVLSRLGPVHIACNDGCDRLDGMAARILDATSGPLAVIGHSMGGRVALELALAAPERVTRLALVASGAHGVGAAEADGRRHLVDLARRDGMGAVADAWMPAMVGAAGRANAGLMQGLKAMLSRCAVDIFAAQQHALLHRQDRMGSLATLPCPTLFVAGDEDPTSSPAFNREMAALARHGQYVELDNAGHMLPIEQPSALAAQLRAFIAG